MKLRRTTAFYVEALVVTFFLLALSTVLLQMFAASHGISVKAQQGSDAVQIAQNVTAQIIADINTGKTVDDAIADMNGVKGENGYSVTYLKEGLPAQQGEYTVNITAASVTSKAGDMYSISVNVANSKQPTEIIFSLPTTHFAQNG